MEMIEAWIQNQFHEILPSSQKAWDEKKLTFSIELLGAQLLRCQALSC